jgi:hypothetical protein
MSLRSRFVSLIPIAVLGVLGACASSEGASRRMLDLNRQALDSFEAGKLPHARELLVEAVTVGKKNGLTKHNTMARTYLDLGAVYLALNERDKGLRNIGLALKIQPDIEPSDQIATPPVKKALARARVELERRRGTAAAEEKTEEKADEKPEKTEKAEKAQKPEKPAKKEPPPPRAIVKAAPAPKPAPPEKAPPPEKPVAAASEPAPPDDEEPDLPANVPQALYCPTPDEAPPATEIALRCVPRPGVSFARIMLFYRPAASETFTQVPMTRSRKGWYSGMVPASAVVGRTLQYYVEAQTTGKKTAAVTNNGQSDSPNLLSIREGAARVGQGTLAAAHFKKDAPASPARDDNPLLEAERERERVLVVSTDHRRRVRSPFVGAGIGSGYGWHRKRVLEFRTEQAVASGFSPGGLLQITPELGWQYDERYAFSAQLRFQIIPESGSGDTKAGHPAHGAWAAFARGYRFLGDGNGQPFLTGTLGGGQGFRLVVPPHPLDGVTRNDTIRGGPIVLGPGAGFLYHFTPNFAWNAEARLLAGLPDFAVLVEFSTGGQVSF